MITAIVHRDMLSATVMQSVLKGEHLNTMTKNDTYVNTDSLLMTDTDT